MSFNKKVVHELLHSRMRKCKAVLQLGSVVSLFARDLGLLGVPDIQLFGCAGGQQVLLKEPRHRVRAGQWVTTPDMFNIRVVPSSEDQRVHTTKITGYWSNLVGHV